MSAQPAYLDPDDRRLARRIEAARLQAAVPLGRDDVEEILRNLVASMSGDLSAVDLALYRELEALARYIQAAKREVEAIRPDDILRHHVPNATDQLDAVVGATEQATHQIMDACDAISAIASGLDAPVEAALVEQVTRVFEACNFQDLTGQRIAKVVRALREIEAKVDGLLRAFGEDVERSAPRPPASGIPDGASEDAGLLNGPQLPGQGIDQAEIDRLLASFE